MSRPLVFDLGMNHGRNIPYYLTKGCRVLGVDANPALVGEVTRQFASAIADGQLIVLNLGVADSEGTLPFYVNCEADEHSSFVRPSELKHPWEAIEIEVVPVTSLIEQFGVPMYLKVDVENYDHVVLNGLLRSGLRPDFISAEAHRVDVVCQLIVMGYSSFQYINGREVGRSIARMTIQCVDGESVEYEFERLSAGPFGDDLPGRWMGAEGALLQWIGRRELLGSGWWDIHARRSQVKS